MRCSNQVSQKRINQINFQHCPYCDTEVFLDNDGIPLPQTLRGRVIQQGNVVPTVARLKYIIEHIQDVQLVNPDDLRAHQIVCLRRYDLTDVLCQNIINPQDGDDWISVVRRNILKKISPHLAFIHLLFIQLLGLLNTMEEVGLDFLK
jgi:hypothetical protein